MKALKLQTHIGKESQELTNVNSGVCVFNLRRKISDTVTQISRVL